MHQITDEIESYSKFVELLENKYFKEQSGTWIFRGHSRDTYKLEPSVARFTHTVQDSHKYERSLLDQFKRCAIPHLRRIPDNDFEWLALAQHHGLPTRLLDWSRNPQVALYFAVTANSDDDACVFALRAEKEISNKSIGSKDPLKLHALRKYSPSIVTNRLAAQEGLFTIHIDLKVPLEEEKNVDWNLECIHIPKKLKQSLSYLLYRLGVHRAALFPDIDGLAEHLKWKHSVSPELMRESDA